MKSNLYLSKVQHVLDAVLAQGGHSSCGLRKTIMDYAVAVSCDRVAATPPPAAWQSYVDTVTKHAYRINDSHVERLKALGQSEDEIFELTIATALGAGVARLEQGLAAIES